MKKSLGYRQEHGECDPSEACDAPNADISGLVLIERCPVERVDLQIGNGATGTTAPVANAFALIETKKNS